MPRHPKVWQRTGRRGWWATLDGKQKFLSEDKKEAERLLHRHLAGMGLIEAKDLLLTDLIDLFIDACTNSPKSKKNYRSYLLSFSRSCGRVKVSEVRKLHLSRWLKDKGWTQATQNTVIGIAKQLFHWGVAEGYISTNPLQHVKAPAMTRRQPIDPDVLQAILEHASDDLRAILTVLRETGARPSELCSARIEHLKGQAIVLKEHKTRGKTGKDRVIYLSAAAQEIVRTEIGERTAGPIFVNRQARGPWKPGTLWTRVKRLCKYKGLPRVHVYGIRHLFASSAINNGDVNPALVARQLGHSDLVQLMKTYFKEDPEAMLRAVEQATRNRESG